MNFVLLRDNYTTRLNLDNVVAYKPYSNNGISIIYNGGVGITGTGHDMLEPEIGLSYKDTETRDKDLHLLDERGQMRF